MPTWLVILVGLAFLPFALAGAVLLGLWWFGYVFSVLRWVFDRAHARGGRFPLGQEIGPAGVRSTCSTSGEPKTTPEGSPPGSVDTHA